MKGVNKCTPSRTMPGMDQLSTNTRCYRLSHMEVLFVVVQSLSCVQTLCEPMDKQARLPCPSPSPRVCSNSCPLSWLCYLTISFSATLFSFCLQSFPSSGSLLTSWSFTSGGKNIGDSASVLPMNIQGWFPLRLTGWIALLSKGLSRVFSGATVKHQSFGALSSLLSSSHIYTWLLAKLWLWQYRPF